MARSGERFFHPLSERRFPTSALALSSLHSAVEGLSEPRSAGVFEDVGDGPARQIVRVERDAEGTIITTKIAEAIREEPEMAGKTNTRKKAEAKVAEAEQAQEIAVEVEPAETVEAPPAKAEKKAPAKAPAKNGAVDREAYAKRLRPKVKKAGFDGDRLDVALKYAIRMALHKDGLRTKPTDFARHGLTKEDVAALAEVI